MSLLHAFITTSLHLVSPKNPDYITEAQKQWDGLADVTVISSECGDENAFYWPGSRTVEMCTELYDNPDLAVAIFNHEMGHAFMHQHNIPNSERGADELSMLTSTPDQLVATAKWFMDMAKAGESGDDGVHASHLDRAAALLCYVDGTDAHPASRECKVYAKSVDENWARMLIMVTEAE